DATRPRRRGDRVKRREFITLLGGARNVRIDYRWVTSDIDRLSLAKEVVEQRLRVPSGYSSLWWNAASTAASRRRSRPLSSGVPRRSSTVPFFQKFRESRGTGRAPQDSGDVSLSLPCRGGRPDEL